MILLDTNYLIRALVPDSEEMQRIVDWVTAGEELITSAVSWYEFLCGPVDEEGITVVSSLIEDRIIPFTRDQAAEAARLFNETGRKRNLRVDAMIASAAILTHAELATENLGDFTDFTASGLQLINTTR
jgi:predicted nucleic acid-binding protein